MKERMKTSAKVVHNVSSHAKPAIWMADGPFNGKDAKRNKDGGGIVPWKQHSSCGSF
jgi:hypothetical protein